MINILFALFSILAGIHLAEIAYALLLTIEYVMIGSFNFELTSAWHYLKIGAGGGGIMGIGIALLRYFGVKGF
ncbi:hypothetical protein [Shimwellia blattae]|uniref:Uncharacterized protein n=1 Tax=Shimwellia blattae (strain ATCC 29907 / DSM 4481 / JCM 1650 / NBRC 105725 / CDC 9005-74) TaxID=630626 RepID=I2B8E5_SHIBC|nr:hypothetical protein [Shimwellia blattae]AFJ46799.1 hypothetical protein EBL_c17050 [Shimwellia blattae DSM 4481 = NBRC 105725]GAB83250.1 hypothetical protein EB105725_64_00030 [Shimwellia blattae DSM 4481 = NBRC 105725]VDY64277.1 Uncharacterised protein [Shimwellia blattae]VEC22402.1 Uncharacterised protein [Shimwellia blattae]